MKMKIGLEEEKPMKIKIGLEVFPLFFVGFSFKPVFIFMSFSSKPIFIGFSFSKLVFIFIIMFGCCTVDIVKQLSSEELSRNSIDVSGDRIRRLAMHLLNQHSFYPLYPPSTSVPLDLSLAPEAMEIPCTPDVLLLPSDLAPFIKVLNYDSSGEETVSCMCINPGRLAKGIGGGTFVELNYNEDSNNSYASIIRI